MNPTVKTGTALLLTQSGCTYMLWTNDNLEAYREPAPNPDLHLYQSQKQDDILVVYREQSERNDSIHTRAYWLNLNQNRLSHDRAPIFASKELRAKLPPIAVYDVLPTALTNQNSYAICDADQRSFVLHSTNGAVNNYNLPVYKDGRGCVEKIALTPVAVSVDICVGVLILSVLAICNANDSDDGYVPTPSPPAHNDAHWSHH